MSTRSQIGILHKDGSITSIYCHWDGFPSHHEPILNNYYFTLQKVTELIDLGDISSLGEKAYPDSDKKHTFYKPVSGVTVAFYRDRGDKTACSHHFDDKHSFIAYAKATFIRWAYLFNEQTGEWNTIDINKEDDSNAVG